MKRFASFFLPLLLCFPAASFAQTQPTVPAVLNLSWTLPTETECLQPAPATCVRLPLTGDNALVLVEVYTSTSPIPDNFSGAPTATLPGVPVTAAPTISVPNGSTVYARLKVWTNFQQSNFSGQVSKLVSVKGKPGVPTDVVINITLT